MGWESFDVVRFDLGPLLQGKPKIAKLKGLIPHLLLAVQVWDGINQLIGNHRLRIFWYGQI